MNRKIYIQNKPLEDAVNIFMNKLESSAYFNIEEETVKVLDSLGRISSKAVHAHRSSPHYVSAAMDGIAVKAANTYGASETSPVLLDHCQYTEVDTGDYVPREFDSVIMIEDVNFKDNAVELIKPAVPWQHIRSVGEDLVASDMLITSCTRIGPYELASLITAAVPELKVVKKPVVAIIPTGTELVDEGSETMAPGEIVESNSRMLMAMCLEWGAKPFRHDIVIDDKEQIRQAVNSVRDKADMIVICSGSSAGREDYSSEIIAETGELLIHGLATRPGKPAILGIIDNKPVLGVPGYPVSAQLIFNLFAKPVLYKKQGILPPQEEELTVYMSRKIASSMGVDEFVYANTAQINNKYVAFPLSRGAGVSTSLVKSDGVIHIERGIEGIAAGEKCKIKLRRSRQMIDKTLVCIGSHDLSIDFLADILHNQHDQRLISSNVGSMGGIMALKRGETHFAGIHLLDEATGDYNISYLNRYLQNVNWLLINLVYREQGLMVKKGNPMQIRDLKDLIRDDVRFINRQRGAGTRVLLDFLLKKENISINNINGYNREEFTHLAVAAAVKNDACDCGLGIYASARALDLDFIPIAEERYDICLLPDLLHEKSTLDTLLQVITSAEFLDRVKNYGGYSTRLTGNIMGNGQK